MDEPSREKVLETVANIIAIIKSIGEEGHVHVIFEIPVII